MKGFLPWLAALALSCVAPARAGDPVSVELLLAPPVEAHETRTLRWTTAAPRTCA